MGTANIWAFIPVQAQPPQGIKNRLLRGSRRTMLIGVFNPQQKFPALTFGKAVVK
jgi:hypothetical protein